MATWRAVIVLLGPLVACAPSPPTELVPEGPPMIRQLILTERYATNSGWMSRPIIAFGTHPEAGDHEQHQVSTATVANQRIRVVMDELLVGNSLEEVQCAGMVDEDDFARIPVGATADDLARCSGEPTALAARCTGAKAVCVRAEDGAPMGILDRVDSDGRLRPDGIPDVQRFIDGAALLRCVFGTRTVDIPVNQDQSYWQPAGTQDAPDGIDDGFHGLLLLGPAVVLVPRTFLPSRMTCHVEFAADVTDKSGLRPCTPPAGDVTAGCEPGDTTLASFGTEPLLVLQQSVAEGAIGVRRGGEISLRTSAPLGAAPQVSSVPAATFNVSFSPTLPTAFTVTPSALLSPNTHYVLSMRLRDSFDQPPEQEFQLSFTTGGMP